MKIVVAPNAFKGSISAKQAADVMAQAVSELYPDINTVKVPFSDGGDGLLEVLRDIMEGSIQKVKVKDPLGREIVSELCIVEKEKIAAIEMARASGLALLKKHELDPTKTTTLGTGELIKYALDLGVKKIIIGIGGSATNDGGIGVASALGIRFLDKNGKELYPCGGNLIKIQDIDFSGLDPRIKECEIVVVCDVDNPLLGENGATRVYGPQKGATLKMIEILEKGLKNLAQIIKRKRGMDITNIPGGGAAGGLGAGLYAFLGGKLKKGIEVMKELTSLDEKIKGASLVITGEGKLDNQIFFGKGPYGVAETANKYNVPCIALCGSIDVNMDFKKARQIGIHGIFTIIPGPVSLDTAMKNVREYLKDATQRVVAFFVDCIKKRA